jgi:hypothetical protein
MKYLPRFVITVFGFICFSLFSQAAFAQDFSSLDSDLQSLEDLILDTLNNTEEQQRLLHDLKQNLDESGNLIAGYESLIIEQENLLTDLRTQLNEMSETFRMQSVLSARYERRSRFWKNFTLVAIPVTALISGGIVWGVMAN